MKLKTSLTVAGSDSSGGAGIQADIKTMTSCGVYAMSAITALTAQNTTGVFSVSAVKPDFLAAQIDAVFEDIVPDSVKIGMLPSAELVRITAERLKHYGASKIVVDPVMVSTSGSTLAQSDAVKSFKTELFPIAALITPNIPEAEVLTGSEIKNRADMERAAKKISEECSCAVLLKGGHSVSDASDVLCDGRIRWFEGEKIDNPNTHGTGCTLSSAIASFLAKGYPLEQSIERAKEYISNSLAAMLDLGHGSGPLNHMASLSGRFFG
ncbi:MAG: bifunctional hydroxymethylpyrimidine kinase/phosphomethylpyrimidine kinase [Eubacteriales bacterium]